MHTLIFRFGAGMVLSCCKQRRIRASGWLVGSRLAWVLWGSAQQFSMRLPNENTSRIVPGAKNCAFSGGTGDPMSEEKEVRRAVSVFPACPDDLKPDRTQANPEAIDGDKQVACSHRP